MNQSEISVSDQLDRTIVLKSPAQRIVSLVPSISELLYDLGLKDRIVGTTKFCIHPEESEQSKRIGGTKNPKIKTISELQPDLVIANKEENRKEDIDMLSVSFNVYVSDISDVNSTFAMFRQIGTLTNTSKVVEELIQEIKEAWNCLPKPIAKAKVLYAIWKKPWMFAGNDTYIHHFLDHLGLENVLQQKRYPVLEMDEIKALSPDFLFLSSEPYPFKSKDADELKKLLPSASILLVDGEAFSWYGSRMKHCTPYIKQLMTELT